MSGGPLSLSLLSGVLKGLTKIKDGKWTWQLSDNLRQLCVVSPKLYPVQTELDPCLHLGGAGMVHSV